MNSNSGRNEARKACYKLFKDADPNYADFLRVWNETEVLNEGDRTATERGHVFRKYAAEAQKTVRIYLNIQLNIYILLIRLYGARAKASRAWWPSLVRT